MQPTQKCRVREHDNDKLHRPKKRNSTRNRWIEEVGMDRPMKITSRFNSKNPERAEVEKERQVFQYKRWNVSAN